MYLVVVYAVRNFNESNDWYESREFLVNEVDEKVCEELKARVESEWSGKGVIALIHGIFKL